MLIKISNPEWSIIEKDGPILFREYSHQRPFPVPKSGGDPFKLFKYLNVKDENHKLLILTWMAASFVPAIPKPILLLHGGPGCAKTTLLKMIKALIDPSVPAVRSSVRDEQEFALMASQHHALFFDNLRMIPNWLSDAMCAAVTGDGYSARRLYTNADLVTFEFRCAIAIAGISVPAKNADILDRAIIVELEPMAPEERKSEDELWSGFNADGPEVLGGIFDLIAKATGIVADSEIEIPTRYRMADFVRWGAAIAEGTEYGGLGFLDAYAQNVSRQFDETLDANLPALALIEFMKPRIEWTGVSADLLQELENYAEALKINPKDKSWPSNATWLMRRLREAQPSLTSNGIKINKKRRKIIISKEDDAQESLNL